MNLEKAYIMLLGKEILTVRRVLLQHVAALEISDQEIPEEVIRLVRKFTAPEVEKLIKDYRSGK